MRIVKKETIHGIRNTIILKVVKIRIMDAYRLYKKNINFAKT
jgi:hypothetical protein